MREINSSSSAASDTSNTFEVMHAMNTPSYMLGNKGELSDQSNRQLNASKLLTAMANLRIDFGLTTEDVLEISNRDGVLLALHLFQVIF